MMMDDDVVAGLHPDDLIEMHERVKSIVTQARTAFADAVPGVGRVYLLDLIESGDCAIDRIQQEMGRRFADETASLLAEWTDEQADEDDDA